MTPQQIPSPSDWQEFNLGELMKFSNGINADKSAYGSGVPFANVLEVINNESVKEDDIPGRIKLPQKILTRYEVRRGDFLFNRTSETQEEVGLASVYLGNQPIVFGGFVFRGRPLTNNLDLGYSKYALRTTWVRDQITARGQGGIRANIGQGDLKTVTVTLPTIPEQRVIAEALDDAASQIKLLERLITKKQAIKQGIMQQLLTGRTRIPGFTKPWEATTFEQLARPASERVDPRKCAPHARLIELENIASGGRLIGSSAAENAISLKTMFRLGDVLFGKLRAYLRKYWLADSEGICSTEIWALRSTARALGSYIRYLVETDQFIETATGGYGTHMPRADWGMLRSLIFEVPSIEEQAAIAAVLDDADSEIDLLYERLAKATATKQGMMQQLLTGRTRLPAQEAIRG